MSGEFTDSGRQEVIKIDGDARALWELETRSDFDPVITMWASNEWVKSRDERIQAKRKN